MNLMSGVCRLAAVAAAAFIWAAQVSAASPLYQVGEPVENRDKSLPALLRTAPVELGDGLFNLLPVSKGTRLELPIIDGTVVATVAHVREGGESRYSLWGDLEGDDTGSFALTINGSDAALTILDARRGWLRLTGTPHGYEIQEFNEEALPGCGSDHIPQVFRRAGAKARERREAAVVAKGDSPVEIDVLVAYTAAARQRAGSSGAIETLILNAAAQGNQAYANSGIDLLINVVHMEEVDYDEDYELALALAKLTFPNDGVMDSVHQLRNTHEADMVSLITDGGDVGGIGWILDALDEAVALQSFSITNYFNLGSLTFPHELGHNMGCDHDQQNITAEGYRLHSYSRGWRFTAAEDSVQYRTVMAYPPGTRTTHFSNPDILYKGTATGVAVGEPDEANCALTINTSAPVIALNRPSTGEGEGDPDGGVEYEGYYCETLGAIHNNTLLRILLPAFAKPLLELLDPPTADLNGGSDPDTLTVTGNGMLDCGYELGVLLRIVENVNLNLSGTGGVTHTQVVAALNANRARIVTDIGTANANIVEGIAPGMLDLAAAYMTIGDDDSVGFVNALIEVVNTVEFVGTLSIPNYVRLPQYLSADGDADGDGATNRSEYDAYAGFGAETYVSFALNPTVFPIEVEGQVDGEGQAEGVSDGEGNLEGTLEGEGAADGEGTVDGEGGNEGDADGEGDGGAEGEGAADGEGQTIDIHSADLDQDETFNLNELLRVVQFFNAGSLSCESETLTEDGFQPGAGEIDCESHDADFLPQDWVINLSELLRIIQLFNLGGYIACQESQDGYCAGT